MPSFLRKLFAELYQAIIGESVLWVDRNGKLRDIDGRPIRESSVSRDRLREAFAKRNHSSRVFAE